MSGSVEYLIEHEVVPELKRVATALEQIAKAIEAHPEIAFALDVQKRLDEDGTLFPNIKTPTDFNK